MGAVPPHKEEIRTLRDYLVGQIAKSGVETRLQTPMSAAKIKEIGADVLIVASGARPLQPRIPVVEARIISAWDVLSGKEVAGVNIVMIGGGEVGCESAEYLATQGKEVVIVELLQDLAGNMEPRGRTLLLQRLRQLDVKVLLQSSVVEVRGATVLYEQGGLKHRIERVDTVVSAVGSVSDKSLGEELGVAAETAHFIGDCVKPRRILEAMREAFELASGI
jgi:pyruvate/2-oxoglutarate dehydrogenase complex dihydrolipoamide dehydrogenase (E3) component